MENKLNHFDQKGNAVMVDVSNKPDTHRTATATGSIQVSPEIMAAVKSGNVKKGDVLGVARVAGIMGVKRTSSSKSGWHYGGKTDISSDSDVSSADDLEVFGRF